MDKIVNFTEEGDKLTNLFKELEETIRNKCRTVGINTEMSSIDILIKKLAEKKSVCVEKEFTRLAKQKVLISGVPYIFSIGVMGFFVSGISNTFTKYRFSKEQTNSSLLKKYVVQ